MAANDTFYAREDPRYSTARHVFGQAVEHLSPIWGNDELSQSAVKSVPGGYVATVEGLIHGHLWTILDPKYVSAVFIELVVHRCTPPIYPMGLYLTDPPLMTADSAGVYDANKRALDASWDGVPWRHRDFTTATHREMLTWIGWEMRRCELGLVRRSEELTAGYVAAMEQREMRLTEDELVVLLKDTTYKCLKEELAWAFQAILDSNFHAFLPTARLALFLDLNAQGIVELPAELAAVKRSIDTSELVKEQITKLAKTFNDGAEELQRLSEAAKRKLLN